MDQIDLLQTVALVFRRLSIRYFVTGSIASSFYGEYRATHDIDVVADLTSADVSPFCAEFPEPDFYVSEDAARGAVARRSQFNVLHVPTASKIDVIVQDASAFDRLRFDRSHDEKLPGGIEVKLASPEDVIIKKLVYYKEGGSEKHLRDIAGILRISRQSINREYVEQWAGHFGVFDAWLEALSREAGAP